MLLPLHPQNLSEPSKPLGAFHNYYYAAWREHDTVLKPRSMGFVKSIPTVLYFISLNTEKAFLADGLHQIL